MSGKSYQRGGKKLVEKYVNSKGIVVRPRGRLDGLDPPRAEDNHQSRPRAWDYDGADNGEREGKQEDDNDPDDMDLEDYGADPPGKSLFNLPWRW